MSAPLELRVLCHQLSSTPTAQLPRITPILLRNALRCQEVLSAEAQNAKKDAPETSVLVHKLKTQISTLLYGKSPDGRFTAVVLIKAIVDVGGWEILRGAEPWMRGMLSVLGKPDPIATKRLCILVLTSIYLSTHKFQSLVREIATPTLPAFVTSCLNLILPISPGRTPDVSSSLLSTVFASLFALIPYYFNIFRPFVRQIRLVIRPYLAPTLCDRRYVCPSLSRDARNLAVILHQTAAKNTGGAEWEKAVGQLIVEIHLTTDQVFRAVIEDWESTTGYISKGVDVNQEIHSQENNDEDLPAWAGIDAGVERVVGLLGLLEEYFKHPTISVVSIPLEAILDLLVRLTSVVPPVNTKGGSEYDGIRLNPAIERIERESLWAGLHQIHIASMAVYSILAERLQHNFAPMAEHCLSQITWIYSELRDESFRSVMYQLISKVLPMCGPSLQKQTITSLTPVMKACCKDVRSRDGAHQPPFQEQSGRAPSNGSSANFDTLLQNRVEGSTTVVKKSQDTWEAAAQLLPLFMSHLPQEHLQGYLRADIDRTSIFARHKRAMLSSVLTPFIGKNGKCYPSILPHLCREFPDDLAVEALLRPRLPVLRQTARSPEADEMVDEALQGPEDMMEGMAVADAISMTVPLNENENSISAGEMVLADEQGDPGLHAIAQRNYWVPGTVIVEPNLLESRAKIAPFTQYESSSLPPNAAYQFEEAQLRSAIDVEEDDTDESIHLAMELSDSEAGSLS